MGKIKSKEKNKFVERFLETSLRGNNSEGKRCGLMFSKNIRFSQQEKNVS
jgi:hypothetical protein